MSEGYEVPTELPGSTGFRYHYVIRSYCKATELAACTIFITGTVHQLDYPCGSTLCKSLCIDYILGTSYFIAVDGIIYCTRRVYIHDCTTVIQYDNNSKYSSRSR